MSARGFTLAELLVALTITLLLAGAIAAAAPAARAVFDRVPAVLDQQQRGRIAIDTLTRAVRAAERVALTVPTDDGRFAELTTVTPVDTAAQGVLDADQPSPSAAMTLAAWRCPNVKDVCGFINGTIAMISDNAAAVDVFTVGSTNAAQRRLTPTHALSRAYPAGSMLLEVEQNTFGLEEQQDGTCSMTRVTAGGAVQPIVDGVSALAFQFDGRRIDIEVVVDADRIFRTSVTVRNPSW